MSRVNENVIGRAHILNDEVDLDCALRKGAFLSMVPPAVSGQTVASESAVVWPAGGGPSPSQWWSRCISFCCYCNKSPLPPWLTTQIYCVTVLQIRGPAPCGWFLSLGPHKDGIEVGQAGFSSRGSVAEPSFGLARELEDSFPCICKTEVPVPGSQRSFTVSRGLHFLWLTAPSSPKPATAYQTLLLIQIFLPLLRAHVMILGPP